MMTEFPWCREHSLSSYRSGDGTSGSALPRQERVSAFGCLSEVAHLVSCHAMSVTATASSSDGKETKLPFYSLLSHSSRCPHGCPSQHPLLLGHRFRRIYSAKKSALKSRVSHEFYSWSPAVTSDGCDPDGNTSLCAVKWFKCLSTCGEYAVRRIFCCDVNEIREWDQLLTTSIARQFNRYFTIRYHVPIDT